MLLTMNWRKEVKTRIANVDAIKENLIDAKAELEEVKKRDTLAKTKSNAESKSSNTGSNKTHPSIILSDRENMLRIKIAEYETIVNDVRRGWKALDKDQRQILDLRYKQNHTQENVAKVMKYDVRTIKRKESEALNIMEKHMIKYA